MVVRARFLAGIENSAGFCFSRSLPTCWWLNRQDSWGSSGWVPVRIGVNFVEFCLKMLRFTITSQLVWPDRTTSSLRMCCAPSEIQFACVLNLPDAFRWQGYFQALFGCCLLSSSSVCIPSCLCFTFDFCSKELGLLVLFSLFFCYGSLGFRSNW